MCQHMETNASVMQPTWDGRRTCADPTLSQNWHINKTRIYTMFTLVVMLHQITYHPSLKHKRTVPVAATICLCPIQVTWPATQGQLLLVFARWQAAEPKFRTKWLSDLDLFTSKWGHESPIFWAFLLLQAEQTQSYSNIYLIFLPPKKYIL